MSRTKNITGDCEHCGAAFVFLAEHIGQTANCPHCGKPTELFLAKPVEEPLLPRRIISWTIAGCLVLVIGLLLSVAALKKAQQLKLSKPSQQAPVTAPARP